MKEYRMSLYTVRRVSSLAKYGPDLRGAVHVVYDVERRALRGGAHLGGRQTRLGRSACVQLDELGCEEGLDCVGIGVDCVETRVDEERFEGGMDMGDEPEGGIESSWK